MLPWRSYLKVRHLLPRERNICLVLTYIHLICPNQQSIPASWRVKAFVSDALWTFFGQHNGCIKFKSKKRTWHDRKAHTAATPARAGTTCPTTARAMIAIVEEVSFITADLSGKTSKCRWRHADILNALYIWLSSVTNISHFHCYYISVHSKCIALFPRRLGWS